MPHKSLSVKIRTRTAGSQRRQSSDNRRPSIAQFLFGSSPSPQSSPLKAKTQSHLSVDSSASISPRNRRYERRSTFVPPDSRTFYFETASESEDETSAFGIGSEDKQKKTSLTVENHPRRRQSPKPATRNSITGVNANAQFGGMRKVMRVVVAGKKGVGKTAFLQLLARYHDISSQPYVPTIDDTYQVQTQAEVPNDRPKELIIFHDTAGVSDRGPIEVLKKQYIQIADAFLLFYSVLDFDSFQKMELIKKHIEKHFGKDKKEVPIVVVGTGVDLSGKQLDSASSLLWATREKVKLFEISTRDRNSIVDVVHYLAGKYFHPMKEPKFSITKKLKPEKSNAQIVMDF